MSDYWICFDAAGTTLFHTYEENLAIVEILPLKMRDGVIFKKNPVPNHDISTHTLHLNVVTNIVSSVPIPPKHP